MATCSQYSCLENSMDRGSWRATGHGLAKSWTHGVTEHTQTLEAMVGCVNSTGKHLERCVCRVNA